MSENQYTMCINNVARSIKKQDANNDTSAVTAFTASVVLGWAFCKDPNDIMADLLSVNFDSSTDSVRK